MSQRIIKICGITRLADAHCALAAGADWLGFIFYPKSARYLTPEAARALIAQLPPGTVTVGVFVNESLPHMRQIAEHVGLTRIQCHGDEPPATLAALAPWQPLKATALHHPDDLAALATWSDHPLVIDTPTPEYGGSGIVGDWALAARAAQRYRILLAGGLTPANIATAIRAVRPWGVDVSSGVEQAKGIKDHARLRTFITNARAAFTAARS